MRRASRVIYSGNPKLARLRAVPPRSRARRPAVQQFAADFLRFCERAGDLGLFYACYPALAPPVDGRHKPPRDPAREGFKKRSRKPPGL